MDGSKIRVSIDPVYKSDLDQPFFRSRWIGSDVFEIRITIMSMDFMNEAAIVGFHRVETANDLAERTKYLESRNCGAGF